jgi:choline dehydrogenase-like flavoprotein
LVFEVDPNLPNPDDLHFESVLATAHDEYALTKTGPLTILPVSIAYIPVAQFIPPETLNTLLSPLPPSSPEDDPTADHTALLSKRFTTHADALGHVEFVFDLGNWGVDNPTQPGKKYASMLQILQYPFSKGSVHIQPSTTPDGTPTLAINPQYFSGPGGAIDLTVALHAHRLGQKICATPPLSGIIRAQVWPPRPPPSETDKNNDDNKNDNNNENNSDKDGKYGNENQNENENETLRTWLRRVATTDWHPVGTCAMGGRMGPRAGVVDERLRVYGVRGLRVVDASVMPLQISAHLQATVYAIAEKGAGMVLEDWGVV